MIIQFFVFFLFSLSFLFLIWRLNVEGSVAYTNPFIYAVGFILLYLLLPALFVNDINHYYSWSLSEEEIHAANLLIVLFSFFVLLWAFIFRKTRAPTQNKTYSVSIAIRFIWFTVLLYLLYVYFDRYRSGTLLITDGYLGVKDNYKIKNVAYLLITVSTLMFCGYKKLWVFTPNVLVAMLDMIDGARTTAFIALVPVFINYAMLYKRTYLKYMVVMMSLMMFVGVFRNLQIIDQYTTPLHINAIGEFRETYILLPNMIFEDDFIGVGGIDHFTKSIIMPFVPGFRENIFSDAMLPGHYAASLISRGYGLGSNILVESIYYGYFFLAISFFLFVIFLVTLYFLISRLNYVYSVILIVFLVVFTRLIVREGILINITLMIFLLIFYVLPFVFADKIFRPKSRFGSKVI